MNAPLGEGIELKWVYGDSRASAPILEERFLTESED